MSDQAMSFDRTFRLLPFSVEANADTGLVRVDVGNGNVLFDLSPLKAREFAMLLIESADLLEKKSHDLPPIP